MIDWYVVLTPLLVLPILLLLRFVGCDRVFGLTSSTYEESVTKEQSLAAYWRLGELNDDPKAKDEKGLHDGDYGQPPATPAAIPPSQAATGQALQGEPGLLSTESGRTSVDFRGGYVVVPFATALNSPSFTVEAWVFPGDWQPGNNHAAVNSIESDGTDIRGFSLASLWNDAAQKSFWAGVLGTGAGVVTLTGPEVKTPPTKTYLAMTYDGPSSMAALYVATAHNSWDVLLSQTVPDYRPDQLNSLYIGAAHVALPPQPLPSPAPPVDVPFIGRIQEVAVYNLPLSEETLATRRSFL